MTDDPMVRPGQVGIKREQHGPFTRMVLSAPVCVPGVTASSVVTTVSYIATATRVEASPLYRHES
jgi:hypothetical protein